MENAKVNINDQQLEAKCRKQWLVEFCFPKSDGKTRINPLIA